MRPSPQGTMAFLDLYRRRVGGLIAALLVANLVVVVKHVEQPATRAQGVHLADGSPVQDPGAKVQVAPGGSAVPTVKKLPAKIDSHGDNLNAGVGGYKPGSFVPGLGHIPKGIYGNKIRVVYYWKGDQAMESSKFLKDTGQQGNLDEYEAFLHLVQYINKHANGGATFMGFPFNLHGRTIEPVERIAGKESQNGAAVEDIVKTDKPFAAVSSHGSMSDFMCPPIAAAGIFNFGTYDLGGVDASGHPATLAERTNGYCVPQATSFETQVEMTIHYLKWQQANVPYQSASGAVERKYGFIYSDYPGLRDIGERLIKRFKSAGINVVDHQEFDHNTEAQASAEPNVINRFRTNEVNTIIAPDSGTPLTFTHAAAANAFTPDWYVWPCSGEDATGMVRLYDASEWAHASGLTCYDPEWNSDLTNDRLARSTEWYRQYQEMAPGQEPPAPTPLVYQSMLPMLVGLTNGGRELTLEGFISGMKAFQPYRYSAVHGKTTNPKYMRVMVGRQDLVDDVAKTYWDPTATPEGSNAGDAKGRYVYPEAVRHTRNYEY
ncbi:MAG: ABC transporter substrate-binding protein [Actinobacteria bacterium]|nr:ABC transporter substrate-binding protein [Actinomycetota bacterium]